jgi:hypothetical protein
MKRVHVVLLALLLGGSIAGCGSGVGEVGGTVRYNGQPLPFGTIQFLGRDGVPRAGKIQADGTFSVPVPAGEAKVIVSCMDEPQMGAVNGELTARERRAAPRFVGGTSLIPQRYADWSASGLTVRVKRGRTVQDFALVAE